MAKTLTEAAEQFAAVIEARTRYAHEPVKLGGVKFDDMIGLAAFKAQGEFVDAIKDYIGKEAKEIQEQRSAQVAKQTAASAVGPGQKVARAG